MPDMGLYSSAMASRLQPEAERAARAWARIQDKKTDIVIIRDGTELPEQSVRLEYDNAGRIVQTVIGGKSKQGLTVFGVLNHPDSSISDTDVIENDRFIVGNKEYKIISILVQLGEIQAYAVDMN